MMSPIGSIRFSFPRLRRLAIGVVVVMIASGCAAEERDSGAGTVVAVTERDFAIKAPERVSAGDLVLQVGNRGPDSHELIVVRAEDSRLPFRTDGLTVDEEALEKATVGVLEAGEPGSLRELQLKLAPGRYQLFCNMSGHYFGGMHAELVVG